LQGHGIRCWLDEKQLRPGDDIREEIDRGIRLWDKVLLCCSKDSLTSWWVDHEIGKAFAKEQALMKERRKKVLALIPLDFEAICSRDGTTGKPHRSRTTGGRPDPRESLTAYWACAIGRSVIANTYPQNKNGSLGFLELNIKF
jgi:hypothetical protein